MSKVTINDFLMKLGFDGKEVTKGLEGLEKRVLRLNKKLQEAQKVTMKGETNHLKALQMKADLNRKQLKAQQAQVSLGMKKSKMSAAEIGLQTKLARLEKQTLDIEYKKLRIQRQQKLMKGDILVKNEQIKRATIQTASAEERAANASRRHAGNSERVARANRSSSNSLRNGVASANKMQNFLLKGALAYGAFQTGKSLVNSLGTTGMASSRAQVGLDAVARHIAGNVGAENKEEFSNDQFTFTKDMALNLNRDVVGTQETWRNMLGASISTIETHGAEGYGNIKDIFKGVTEASAIFKLNSTQTKLMFLGVQQSLQKGKLQAEEVIRQIAERSPLAIGQLVKSIRTVRGDMSITEKDMYDLMRNGELMAYEILPEWGRNLSRMSQQLAGGDLGEFMQKSAAGAWDGVGSAIQNIQIGFFEKIDASLARILSTFKELLNNIEFVWKPVATWFSNVFDLANNDLNKLLTTAKKGTGIFASVFGHTGGQNAWDDRIKNMSPEKQRANSEALFARSKAFYTSFKEFFVGSTPEQGVGGFFGGILDFFTAAKTAVLALKDVLTPMMESMGLSKDSKGNIFSVENLGWLGGAWLTSNLTGATNMFLAMTEAFGSVANVLKDPAFLALLTFLGANAATGENGLGGAFNKTTSILTSGDSSGSKAVQIAKAIVIDPMTHKVTPPSKPEGVVDFIKKGWYGDDSLFKGLDKTSSQYSAGEESKSASASEKFRQNFHSMLGKEWISHPNKNINDEVLNPFHGESLMQSAFSSSVFGRSAAEDIGKLDSKDMSKVMNNSLLINIATDGVIESHEYVDLTREMEYIIDYDVGK